MENRRRPADANIISYDGYLFTTKYTKNGIRYVRCVSFREACRATGKVAAGGEFVPINPDHNHPRIEENIRARDFKKQLKEASIRERGNLKNIYERISARDPDGAVFVPYNSIRGSMLRWRGITTPNIPANLEELANILQTGDWPRFSVCANGLFLSGSVVSGDHRAVIFGNQDFLRNFVGSQYAFVDGTFKVVPRRPNFSQILTLFATSMDHAFPVIHVFMERRTRGLYDAVFAYISRTFPNFMNQNIIADYEVALTASLRASYPHTTLRGCFFHFCQAILRKAKMLGVVRQIEGNLDGRILLRKYFALALLPPEMIVPVFEALQDDNPELNGVFRELHNYVRRQWIEQVTPVHFSVFKQRHRTNNVMESYHRRLNSKLVRHPGVWDLMETLIDIQNTAATELAQLERLGNVYRRYVVFRARLDEAWNKLEDGRFTVQDFLRQAVHLVEGIDRHLHHGNENAADEEYPAFALLPFNPDPMNQNPPPALHHLQDPPAPNQNEPPPLRFFQPQHQPILAEVALPRPQLPEGVQVLPQVPHPIQLEPPPLIFFNAQPPEPLPRHDTPPPNHNIPDFRAPTPPPNFLPSPDRLANTPSPPPRFPPSPDRLANTPSPPPHFPPSPDRLANTPPPLPLPHFVAEPLPDYIEEPLPNFVEVPSPERPARVPFPVYNFPPIPDEVGRAFAEFNNENIPGLENIVGRWEPAIPVTEYEDSMSPALQCKVCYLNKVQYVLACGHAFCTTCASTLFNVQPAKCAICRTSLGSEPRPFYL